MRTPEITARLQGRVKRVEKVDGVNWISYVRSPMKPRTLLQIAKRNK